MSTSQTQPLLVGVSANWLHANPERTIYNGRPLLFMEQSMSDWLLAAGALPVMLPAAGPGSEPAIGAREFVSAIDALVIAGGADVWPGSYEERPLRPEWAGDRLRDAAELELVRAAIERDIPVLGICRGHQVLNVALGGTLFQDIGTQVDDALNHRDAERYERNIHNVTLVEGGYLHRLYGCERGLINSVHHQAIKDLAPGLAVSARSTADGIIEGVWLDDESERWVVGVQWHPEFQSASQSELLATQPLLQDFFAASLTRRGKRS